METHIDWPSATYAWTEHGYELAVPLTAALSAGVEPRMRHEIDAELEERLARFHGLHHVLEPADPARLVLRAPHLFQLPAADIRTAVDEGVAAALALHARRTQEEAGLAEPWLAALRAG
ncbi:MAG: hypothetical protein ACTHMS_03115 [Jatrophihabitans sp.]|uniref:hypothetical protein n=1 Tax=Jatrophihabitans sp. TaxID=1932789 RepID=UPI003F7E5ED7